jgi:hypothetical protein
MTPIAFREIILDPGLALLATATSTHLDDRAARVLLLAIAGQESGWESRRQIGGPARGFWQFERGGAVRGVLNHPVSTHPAAKLCAALAIPADEATVYEALAWSDHLAVGLARLLLLTDPAPLPGIGDEAGGWACYVRNWRPGKPHPDVWPLRHQAAVAAYSPKQE